ncbi:MAG: cupin domain-containing protein [Anaerolineae bacterium]|nr:cupin domain-containing protein [Anaerolineae bacterium]
MPAFKYANLPVARPAPDTLRRQVHTEHMMVTIVDFVDGPSPAAPPHQHPHEQITYIAEGRVHFVIGEGDARRVDLVEPGDVVVVPANAPHTVEVLTPSARLIDCFYPIREDFL